ncbi:GTPase HflX [Leptolyngbya sp. FACHB-711]|uniref:GTPase HflX n=1 Tax=unclassified Leptolyngbya TaxID=2650499 RepID=UPI001683C34C|nr:GTPase HflX [Leptolyngbya sp. FACHB-711]MBD1851078.1 GTPase HflX [Cyanobacteria bacterium FACHB-502]MBD2022934.1 GTPase HflX [Leptolyngbya sp. FACHB-711]
MPTVYGNLQGIRSAQLKQIEALYDQRQLGDRVCTIEFARQLAQLSSTIHHPICVYLNRRGQVIRIGIGTPLQTQLPQSELPRQGGDRLSGIRCVSVMSHAPDRGSLVAMLKQRWDALAVLVIPEGKRQKAAEIQETYLVHLIPDFDQPWTVSEPMPLDELTNLELDDLIYDWEKDLGESGFELDQFQAPSDHDRVLLVGLMTDGMTAQQFEEGMTELRRLVDTAGGEVIGVIEQRRGTPHPQTVVGQGKVEEIALQVQTQGANLVVFDRDISPSQARNLEEQIGVRVVDRTEIILDIFAQRAQSQAGKLQVELAQLEYRLPRLRGQGRGLSRLGAGIGTRGPGETKLESERRTIQRRIQLLQQEVNQLQAHRSRLRQQRQQQQIPVVGLVGYTNAGKSTLLNVLTQAEVYAADQLFATLDPTTRRLTIADDMNAARKEILLTDTVGFIHHLPPALMDAFRATLEEVTEADALVHLVDLSHPAWASHIKSVETVLDDLPATPPTALLAFNKIDHVPPEVLTQVRQDYPDAVFISATERLGLDRLKQEILKLLGISVQPGEVEVG